MKDIVSNNSGNITGVSITTTTGDLPGYVSADSTTYNFLASNGMKVNNPFRSSMDDLVFREPFESDVESRLKSRKVIIEFETLKEKAAQEFREMIRKFEKKKDGK